jgi:hypothetical protein
VNGSPINVEDQGDLGFQTLLAGVITGRSIELSLDGYEEDQVIRDIAMAATSSGQFYEDGQTFTASFTSDAAWTYTPAV